MVQGNINITLTIRLGATPSGLTTAPLHHPPIFFTGRMPFLLPNQQRQNTEGNTAFIILGENVLTQWLTVVKSSQQFKSTLHLSSALHLCSSSRMNNDSVVRCVFDYRIRIHNESESKVNPTH